MVKKERNMGIELLRILAMFFVVLLHILGQGGVLEGTTLFSLNYELAWLLECAAYCAVNCYALISGYVGLDSRFKFTNILRLWLQAAFYTVALMLLFALFRPETVSLTVAVKSFLPFMTTQYWYLTAYVGLFFFIPVLNAAVNSLPKRPLGLALCGLLILYSVLNVPFRSDPFHLETGYSALWLIFLYLLGAYAKKHDIFAKLSPRLLALLYLAGVLLTWGSKLAAELLTRYLWGQANYGSILLFYSSPTVVLSALSLLGLFSKISVPAPAQRWVSFIAPVTFGVYLIHANGLVWYAFFDQNFVPYASLPAPAMLAAVLSTAAGIFIVCALLDHLRLKLFALVKIPERLNKLEEKLQSKP